MGERASRMEEKTRKLLDATGARNVCEAQVKLMFGEVFDLPTSVLEMKVHASGAGVLELADAIALVGSSNKFNGAKVSRAIGELHYRGCISSVEFGREYSPVVYIHLLFWTYQASNFDGDGNIAYMVHHKLRGTGERRLLSLKERAVLVKEIFRRLRATDPDELDGDDMRGRYTDDPEETTRVRAWWD